MSRSRTRNAPETRAAILEAARQRFASEGFEASLSSIVADAGITKGALFHHFENKQALYLEVWTNLQTDMARDTQKAALANRSPDDPYQAILAGCRRYLEWTTRPDFQRIVLIEGRGVLGMTEWMSNERDVGREVVRSAIGYLVQRGLIADDRASTLSVIVQGALHGAGLALARNIDGVTVDSICCALDSMLRQMK
ncbi:MAG TPA: hypothetical protein DDX09_08925 [Hyphomonas atlantica]|nr:hypothetical protein [Hyphomonas atlantica]